MLNTFVIYEIIVYAGFMLIGLFFSRKRPDISAFRKLIGFLLPAAYYLYEHYLMKVFFDPKTINAFVFMAMFSFILKLFIFWLSLYLMTGYVPSKGVIVVLVIIAVLYFFKSIHTGQTFATSGVLNYHKSNNVGLVALRAFFNNPKGSYVSDLICSFAPPISMILEAAASLVGSKRR